MICKNTICIYNESKKCTFQNIVLDETGCCTCFEIISFSDINNPYQKEWTDVDEKFLNE